MNAHLIGPGKSRAAVNQRKTKMKRRKVENDGIGGREAIGATKHWGVFEAKEYLCWVGLEFGMDFLNFLQGSKFKGMLQLTHHRLPRLSTFRHFFITPPPPGQQHDKVCECMSKRMKNDGWLHFHRKISQPKYPSPVGSAPPPGRRGHFGSNNSPPPSRTFCGKVVGPWPRKIIREGLVDKIYILWGNDR